MARKKHTIIRRKEPLPGEDPLAHARRGLEHLQLAREHFDIAGAARTTARIRLAITSAKGAVRNAEYRLTRAQWGA